MKFVFLCLYLVPLAFAQSDDLKRFDREGKDLFEAGNYAEALKQFKAAYREDPKAQLYKEDGNFFQNYLPRYWIALCYEKIDVLEAAEWVKLSQEALERDTYKKKRDKTQYDEDMERILKAAETARIALKREYDLKLNDAKSLVSQYKFDEARKAYEALVKMDADRPEARAGLAGLSDARKTYLDRLSLNVERAIFAKKWRDAEAEMATIAAVDKGYVGLPALQAKLDSARKEANKPKEPVRQPVQVADNTPKETEPKITRPKPTPAKADPEAEARAKAANYRKQLRSKLLETVAAYRQGEPDKALALLKQIPTKGTESFGSYFWLKGLYNLSTHRSTPEPDPKLLEEARTAMKTVAKLMPKFQPEERLYPNYVIDFYASVK